jgi:hypothetical protein
MKTWTTKDGKKIPYNKLEDSHLLNILKFIEKKAEEGISVFYGGCGSTADEMWADEEILTGEEVKEYMDYYTLKKEAYKRGLLKKESER